MDTHEVLVKGRNRYEANPSHSPWGRMPEFGTVCAVLALDGGLDYYPQAQRELCDAAGLADSDCRMALIKWNARSSTAAVLAAFDKAIAATAPPPADPLADVQLEAEVVA